MVVSLNNPIKLKLISENPCPRTRIWFQKITKICPGIYMFFGFDYRRNIKESSG